MVMTWDEMSLTGGKTWLLLNHSLKYQHHRLQYTILATDTHTTHSCTSIQILRDIHLSVYYKSHKAKSNAAVSTSCIYSKLMHFTNVLMGYTISQLQHSKPEAAGVSESVLVCLTEQFCPLPCPLVATCRWATCKREKKTKLKLDRGGCLVLTVSH